MAYRSALAFFLLLNSILFSYQASNNAKPHILHSWKFADFAYSNENDRSAAIQRGQFQPRNVVILDSDYYISPITLKRRVFVTTPKFNTGIPATISEITQQMNSEDEMLLVPFPSWNAQSTTNCEHIISVYRIHIDRCGLLWVLDSGRVDTFTSNARRVCRPKLLIYDLKKQGDPSIGRYEFPDGSITNRSSLVSLVTESHQHDCLDSFAYMADVNGYRLVVFDLARKRSWRVESNFFYPFPDRGTISVADVTFDLMDGVLGLALSPATDNPRKLYFHSLASTSESWISTNVLRDQNLVQNTSALRGQFHMAKDVRDGQSTLEVMTDDGVLIYSVLPRSALACWNSAHPMEKTHHHIIYEDAENLQFVSGMKLKGKELLITSSRLQNYIAGHLDNNDVKYRLVVIENVEQLLKGSPCKSNTTGGELSWSEVPEPQRHQPIHQNSWSSSSHY